MVLVALQPIHSCLSMSKIPPIESERSQNVERIRFLLSVSSNTDVADTLAYLQKKRVNGLQQQLTSCIEHGNLVFIFLPKEYEHNKVCECMRVHAVNVDGTLQCLAITDTCYGGEPVRGFLSDYCRKHAFVADTVWRHGSPNVVGAGTYLAVWGATRSDDAHVQLRPDDQIVLINDGRERVHSSGELLFRFCGKKTISIEEIAMMYDKAKIVIIPNPFSSAEDSISSKKRQLEQMLADADEATLAMVQSHIESAKKVKW